MTKITETILAHTPAPETLKMGERSMGKVRDHCTINHSPRLLSALVEEGRKCSEGREQEAMNREWRIIPGEEDFSKLRDRRKAGGPEVRNITDLA